MLDERMLTHLETALRRIFAMNVSRSTFREVQNTIIDICKGDKELITDLFESLFTGQPKSGLLQSEKQQQLFQEISRHFSILIRLAKEVFERGEFVNIVSSDLIAQGEEIAFLNRVKRVDGEEFLFLTDPAGTMHLFNHFFGRLQEMHQNPSGQSQVGSFKKNLLALSNKLNEFASSLPEPK